DASNYHVTTSPIRVAFSNGTGFDAPVAFGSGSVKRLWRRQENSQNTQFADVDGDGLLEIVDMVQDANDPTLRRAAVHKLQLQPGGFEKIVSVQDEQSQETVSYDNMSAGSTARGIVSGSDTYLSDLGRATCAYPARCVSKGVVVSHYQNDRAAR